MSDTDEASVLRMCVCIIAYCIALVLGKLDSESFIMGLVYFYNTVLI